MEIIFAIIEWVKLNGGELVAFYTGLVTLASIIVKMTKTLKDDTILLKITKFIAKYFALNTNAPAPEDRPK